MKKHSPEAFLAASILHALTVIVLVWRVTDRMNVWVVLLGVYLGLNDFADNTRPYRSDPTAP